MMTFEGYFETSFSIFGVSLLGWPDLGMLAAVLNVLHRFAEYFPDSEMADFKFEVFLNPLLDS